MFVIVLNNDVEEEDLSRLCQRIQACIGENIDIKHTSINVGVSIGIHIGYPQDESLDVIIDDADKAMYAVKESNRRTCASISG